MASISHTSAEEAWLILGSPGLLPSFSMLISNWEMSVTPRDFKSTDIFYSICPRSLPRQNVVGRATYTFKKIPEMTLICIPC